MSAILEGSDAPRPGALHDFQALSFCEQLLLWSLRSWLQAMYGPVALHTVVREAFSRVEADKAYLAFDHLASVISVSSRRPILIHCPGCRGVGEDELLFLGLIAEVQKDDVPAAFMNLAEWLVPAGVRAAMPALTEFAMQLTAAGLVVRSWEEIRLCPVLRPAPRPNHAASRRLH